MYRVCTNCRKQTDSPGNFCEECGTRLPEQFPSKEIGKLVGDKNVISTSGGDIAGMKITGGRVILTNIHHAQDDTKKRIQCHYTNQGLSLEDVINCPSCKKNVSRKNYFDFDKNRCNHCNDEAKNKYRTAIGEYLSDGRLDASEIQKLDILKKSLSLSDDVTMAIEKAEREMVAVSKSSSISNQELRDLDVLRRMFESNKHIKQGASIASLLYNKSRDVPEVSFYYYLNKLDTNPNDLLDNVFNSREDNLFETYFATVSAVISGEHEKAEALLKIISFKFDEYYYLNAALKALLMAYEFNYEPNNKLINEKIDTLIQEINTLEIKGIHLSAYLGIITFLDHYCCSNRFSKEILKHCDSISSALGDFLIDLRGSKLKAEKRRIEDEKQRELERIELEKLEKKKAEEKLRAEEKKRIEQEKLEKKKKHDFELEEKRKRIRSAFIVLISNKDVRNGVFLVLTTVAMILAVVYLPDIDTDAKLDNALSKKYEAIMNLIDENELKEARIEILDLTHPSNNCRDHDNTLLQECLDTYSDYWRKKREELRGLIERKSNHISSVTDRAQQNIKGDPNADIKIDKPEGNSNVKQVTEEDTNKIFTSVEQSPEFPGGNVAFGKYLSNNIRYPAIAKENNVQGKVFLNFIVERDGSLTDIKLIRGIGSGCDDEAIRVLKSSPHWKPGILNGREVRVYYTVPISFTLAQEE